jgi:hypothetical protein
MTQAFALALGKPGRYFSKIMLKGTRADVRKVDVDNG